MVRGYLVRKSLHNIQTDFEEIFHEIEENSDKYIITWERKTLHYPKISLKSKRKRGHKNDKVENPEHKAEPYSTKTTDEKCKDLTPHSEKIHMFKTQDTQTDQKYCDTFSQKDDSDMLKKHDHEKHSTQDLQCCNDVNKVRVSSRDNTDKVPEMSDPLILLQQHEEGLKQDMKVILHNTGTFGKYMYTYTCNCYFMDKYICRLINSSTNQI